MEKLFFNSRLEYFYSHVFFYTIDRKFFLCSSGRMKWNRSSRCVKECDEGKSFNVEVCSSSWTEGRKEEWNGGTFAFSSKDSSVKTLSSFFQVGHSARDLGRSEAAPVQFRTRPCFCFPHVRHRHHPGRLLVLFHHLPGENGVHAFGQRK